MRVERGHEAARRVAVQQQPRNALLRHEDVHGGRHVRQELVDRTHVVGPLVRREGAAVATQVQCVEVQALRVMEVREVRLEEVVDEAVQVEGGAGDAVHFVISDAPIVNSLKMWREEPYPEGEGHQEATDTFTPLRWQ